MGQVTVVERDWCVQIELPNGHQLHHGNGGQHLCDGGNVKLGIGPMKHQARVNGIAARGGQDDLILAGNRHRTGETVGGCPCIQECLHFFDQLSVIQNQSPLLTSWLHCSG